MLKKKDKRVIEEIKYSIEKLIEVARHNAIHMNGREYQKYILSDIGKEWYPLHVYSWRQGKAGWGYVEDALNELRNACCPDEPKKTKDFFKSYNDMMKAKYNRLIENHYYLAHTAFSEDYIDELSSEDLQALCVYNALWYIIGKYIDMFGPDEKINLPDNWTKKSSEIYFSELE